MRIAWLLVVATAGCRFDLGGVVCNDDRQCRPGGMCQPNSFCTFSDPSCESGQRYEENSGNNSGVCVGVEPTDAGIDSICFGVGLVKPCFPTAPTGIVTLTNLLDTSTSPLCSTTATSADGFCVIAGETIRVDEFVRVVGAKPLVLVATGTIEISETLDAASHNGVTTPFTTVQVGTGSDPSGCTAGTLPTAGTSGGGGAGGSFGSIGGVGGAGVAGVGGTATPGQPGATQTAATLRGGCPGQNGINGTFGRGGHGGGAVYLIASVAINISGAVNASGEGGLRGTDNSAGAGGGGSGGMIVLDAPTIMNSGVVFANGGSGGEGSGNTTPGTTGPEPRDAAASLTATAGTSSGGDGGAGGAGTATGVNGSNGTIAGPINGGGGGGGGGVGVIKVYRGTLGGQHSPPPS